jgi:hypothetical protein
MAVEVVLHPYTCVARGLLGIRGDRCSEGLKAIIIDGMVVEGLIFL